MKKTITKSYETIVCDICGAEDDLLRRREIHKCLLCGQDVCSACEVYLRFSLEKNGHITYFEKKLCKKHLPAPLLDELVKSGGFL